MAIDARAYAENALGRTLEGECSDEVRLVSPSTGESQIVRGQVLWSSTIEDPATGARIVVDKPVATVRRSSLTQEPKNGENWSVWIPKSNVDDTMVMHMLSRAMPHGSIGMLRLYLTLPEEHPA